MYKRILIVGLFALSLVLLLWRVEAEAGCSCIKYFGGSCLTNCGTMQPKGLLSSLSGLTTGPGTKFVTVGAEGLCPGLSSIPGGTCDTTREDASILFSCVNNGGNFSQGNQAVTASATMTGASQVTAIDGKGKFKNVPVTSLVQTTPQLNALCQDLGGQTWQFFDGAFCDSDPDPAHPGAPGVFEVVGNIVLSDQITVDGQLRLVCTQPCSNLHYFPATGTFTGSNYACQVCETVGSNWDCSQCTLAGGQTNCKTFSAP